MSDNNDIAADLLEDYGFHEQAFRLRRLWRFEKRLARIRGTEDWPPRLYEGLVFALDESVGDSAEASWDDRDASEPLYSLTEIQRIDNELLVKAQPYSYEP